MEKISVIIPVYNAGLYIGKCIESLYKQKDVIIRPIIVDDGSNDSSLKICEKWKEKWSDIELLQSGHNGVSHARNMGLDFVDSGYVSFVDADDWIEDDFFVEMLNALFREQADVVDGGYVRDYGNKGMTWRTKKGYMVFNQKEAITDIFLNNKEKNMGWEACAKLFKRSVIGNVRFNEDIGVAEDMLFVWEVLLQSDRIVSIPKFGYHYQMTDNSAMRTSYNPKKLDTIKAGVKMMTYYNALDNDLRKVLTYQWFEINITYMKRLLIFPNVDKELILKERKWIKQNFFRMFDSYLSVKQKVAVLFYLLPLSFLTLAGRIFRIMGKE